MTQNQIAYQAMLETQRANRAKEGENYRSNVAKEEETRRSNIAKELETRTHNTNTEYLELMGKLSDPITAGIYAAGGLANLIGGVSGRDLMPSDYNAPVPSIYSNASYDSKQDAPNASNSARGR